MRLALAICLSLVMSGAAHGQTGNDPESVIRRMVDIGFHEGHDQKVVGRLGDAGAVLVTKILAGRDLTPSTVDNVLAVLYQSFADPTFVETTSDRQPRTSLLLLRYLDSSASDAALKKRIADTAKYVQDRYAASVQATKQ